MGGKNATKHIWKSAMPDSWWLNKTSCESFEHVWCTLAYGLLPTPWQAPLWRGPIPTKMVFLHTLAWKCLRDMRWYEGSLDVLKPQQTISCKEKRTLPSWPPLQLKAYSSFSSSGLRPAGCAIPHTCTISRSHFTDVLDGLDTQQKHTKTQSFIIVCMSDSPPAEALRAMKAMTVARIKFSKASTEVYSRPWCWRTNRRNQCGPCSSR